MTDRLVALGGLLGTGAFVAAAVLTAPLAAAASDSSPEPQVRVGHVSVAGTSSFSGGTTRAGRTPSPAAPATSPTIPGPIGDEEPAVNITIRTLEPAAPEPGDLLVVEGTVTNVTEAPLINVQALLRHNLNPLTSQADLELVDSDPRLVWGSRPGHVFAEVARSLPAGSSAGFRLEVQLETACPQPVPGASPCVQIQHPGVYVFGIDIREGDPNIPGARVDAGTTLSLLPWLIGSAGRSVEVALLWPVSGAPAINPDGSLGETAAGTMVGPVGWLNTLLDAPGDAPVTWVVDPDLLDTVAAVADGDGLMASSAENWLTAFDSVTSERRTWLLPYAVPDVTSFDRPVATRLAETAARLTRQSAGGLAADTRAVAWPVDAANPEAELTAFRAAGITTAIVPSDALGTDGGPWVDLPAEDRHLTGLVADAALSAAIQHAGEGVALRQRWLAASALAVLTAQDGESPQLVASPPLGWRPSHEAAASVIEAWTTTPWVQPVSLEDIDTTAVPATLAVDADTVEQPSPTAEAAADLLARMDQYETLLAEPAEGEDFSTVSVRAASAAWRTDPDAGRAYIAEASADVMARLSQVAVEVAPTVTLSSNTGAFPVNVVNRLDRPVTVRLELESANPQRMSVEPVTAQRIEPGETEILLVTAEAVANGKVRVDLQLATVDGVPLGRATHTVVNATEYGVVGWFLIVGAGLLFVAGLAVRTLRGRRRNGTADAAPAHLPDQPPLERAGR